MHKRVDPVPTGHMWRRRTLAELTRRRQRIRMWCGDCGHEIIRSSVFLAMFGNLPYEITLYDVVQRLHCRKCGSRHVSVEPSE
jgi:hypothetical protein